jgi:hypothetical protein
LVRTGMVGMTSRRGGLAGQSGQAVLLNIHIVDILDDYMRWICERAGLYHP